MQMHFHVPSASIYSCLPGDMSDHRHDHGDMNDHTNDTSNHFPDPGTLSKHAHDTRT